MPFSVFDTTFFSSAQEGITTSTPIFFDGFQNVRLSAARLEANIEESKNSKPVFVNIKREVILTFFLSNPRFKAYVIARLKIVKKVYKRPSKTFELYSHSFNVSLIRELIGKKNE